MSTWQASQPITALRNTRDRYWLANLSKNAVTVFLSWFALKAGHGVPLKHHACQQVYYWYTLKMSLQVYI